MSQSSYERERDLAIHVVGEAARLCRAVGSAIAPDVLAKKDRSPVTVADFGAQALICRALNQAYPADPIIAEEDSAELGDDKNASILREVVERVGETLKTSTNPAPLTDDPAAIDAATICRWIDSGRTSYTHDRFWTLDPIDGTKGFLRGEQYAVALALVVDGQVVVAALACPNLALGSAASATVSSGTIFYAVRGEGSFAIPAETFSETTPTQPVPLHVSLTDDPTSARFCESVEAAHSAQGDAAAIARHLGMTAPGLRIDSQAKYAVVARGEADIYLRLPTSASYREKIWDHAAGSLIVTEAGGLVTDIMGRPLDFQHGRELSCNTGVIVTNRRLHPLILETLRSVVPIHFA